MKPEVKSKYKRCGECGLKIRGKNHENGEHHIRRAVGLQTKKAER